MACVIVQMSNVTPTAGAQHPGRCERAARNVPGADYDRWQETIGWDNGLPEDRRDWLTRMTACGPWCA
jgi:hypothetical protein